MRKIENDKNGLGRSPYGKMVDLYRNGLYVDYILVKWRKLHFGLVQFRLVHFRLAQD